MTTLLGSKLECCLNFLLLLVYQQDDTLFCSKEELTGTSFVVPLHRGATDDLHVFGALTITEVVL